MGRVRVSDSQRFWAKVLLPEHPEGCMRWTSTTLLNGYGQFRYGPRPRQQQYAHRVAWELCNGPIPPGMMIDHLCHNPECVRPDHLEPVTASVNAQRRRYVCDACGHITGD